MNETFKVTELAAVDTPRQLCWIRFGENDRQLLGGGYDGRIRRWRVDGKTLVELTPLEGFHGWVQAFAQHPGQPLLYAADSWGRVACYEYAGDSPQLRWELPAAHDGWIRSMAITPDGKWLATGGNDGMVRVLATADGSRRCEIQASQDDLYAVAIHPDGAAVVSGDLFCTLKAWDVASGQCLREFDAAKLHFYDRDQDVCGLRILQFREDGRTLVCAGAEPTEAGRGHGVPVIYLFDWESGALRRRLAQGPADDGFIADLVTHPSGFFLTVTTGQPGKGKLMGHRADEDKPFLEYAKMSNTHSIALRSDGRQCVVAATNRQSQGNGAVKDKDGNYLGNYSPLHLLDLASQ